MKSITKDQLVTLEDLEDFKRDLLVSIQGLLSQHTNVQAKKWLKSYEVKRMLGISHGTLQRLRNKGMIPFSKIGGIIYYDMEAVNKVLNPEERNF